MQRNESDKNSTELNFDKTYSLDILDSDDLLNFKLIISSDGGIFTCGHFVFSFAVGQAYPHEPSRVRPTVSTGAS